ncbi:MAG: acyl-CoA dehydrogenase family protein [Rhizobiaceae bacterium]|nr:acyl-CoA dehydrogenase family protein [Rhizobiaceae bacterium]
MNFEFSEEDLRMQAEVRDYLAAAMPADIARRAAAGFQASKEDIATFTRILNNKGWVGRNWPREYGGPGWDHVQADLFQKELARVNAPHISYLSVFMVAPVIFTFGTEEQKAKYLPAIANADIFFCQGFSEPNAGSDLVSLSTTAVRDGDHYIVNGTKTWTSEAHFADKMFTLVKTDMESKPQRGISFLLIDMDAPGVEMIPLQMYNHQYTVNEVRLTNVRVPVSERIGEENKGWDYAKFLLSRERSLVAQTWLLRRELDNIKENARKPGVAGGLLMNSKEFRRRVAQLEIQLDALHWQMMRLLTGAAPNAAAAGAVLKVRGGEMQQQISRLAVDALGPYANAYVPDPDPSENHDLDMSGWTEGAPAFAGDHAPGKLQLSMFRRAVTIFGGSSEVQHNIIAKTLWGF